MPLHVKPPIEPDKIIAEHYRQMNKKRWAKVDTLTRSKMMSEIAKKRWGKMNKKQRSKYALEIGLAGAHKKKKAKVSVEEDETLVDSL